MIILVIILCIVVLTCIGKNRHKKETISKIEKMYGKLGTREYDDKKLESIKKYYLDTKDTTFFIDDITYNDLNMDKIYRDFNTSASSVGDEYTYKALRSLEFSDKKLIDRDNLSIYFEENEKNRIKTKYILFSIGFSKISIYENLQKINNAKESSNIIEYLMLFFMVLSIGFSFFIEKFAILFIILMVVNIFIYMLKRANIKNYLSVFKKIIIMKKALKKVYNINKDALKIYEKSIKFIDNSLSYVNRYSILINEEGEDIFSMLLSYLYMIFHFDIIFFNILLKKIRKDLALVIKMYELIGEIEFALNIASYKKAVKYYTQPEFVDDKNMEIEGIYHPLIKDAIENSINISKNILITGSNASGKSTFLKTIGINAIFAQTIYMVLSKKYKSPFMKVMSSMALHDDIEKGESYYMVEIKALKRIFNEDSNIPTLCLIDEILRGTNTIERISASSIILEDFYYKNYICIAATHDMELTSILEDMYENYYFSENIDRDDIKFDYKLKYGKSTSRNAIKLLKIIGFSEDLVKKANDRAIRLSNIDGEKYGVF